MGNKRHRNRRQPVFHDDEELRIAFGPGVKVVHVSSGELRSMLPIPGSEIEDGVQTLEAIGAIVDLGEDLYLIKPPPWTPVVWSDEEKQLMRFFAKEATKNPMGNIE